MEFEWTRGRLLDTVTVNNTEIQMYYDSNGLKTQKGDIYYYYDSESKLIALKKNALTMFFYYDSAGNPIAFSYNGCMHYYVKNLQGDIVRVVNEAGNTVASYEYDAWGKLLAAKNYYGVPVTDPNSIVLVNPLRYRGYVYDDETGLYYLQSRYYDPTTCRFINADMYCDTQSGSPLSTNMFMYCENCPTIRHDVYGARYDNLAVWFYDSADYQQHFRKKWNTGEYVDKKRLYDLSIRIYNENKRLFGTYNNFIFGQAYYGEHHSIRIPDMKLLPLLSSEIYVNCSLAKIGCGPIAVYNVLCRYVSRVNLADLILEMSLNSLLYPAFGLNQENMKEYFNSHSMQFETIDNTEIEKFVAKRKYEDFSTLVVFTSKTIGEKEINHTYVIINTPNGYYWLNRFHWQSTFMNANWDDVKNTAICIWGFERIKRI